MGGYRLANAGSIKREKGDTGDTSVKGETGATGVGLTIKGSYDSYEELIAEHPTGNNGDSYLVNESLYVWNGNAWENVGNIKGDIGATSETGQRAIPELKGTLETKVLKVMLGILVLQQMKTQDGNCQSMRY